MGTKALLSLAIASAISGQSLAQSCSRPSEPDISENYRALQKRASYAAFLAEECGFDNEVSKRYQSMIRMAFELSPEAQQKALEEFRARKRQFATDASFIGIKKRCLIDTGKTRAFVNDAADDVSSYEDTITSTRKRYSEKLEEWNVCLARQRAAEEAARAKLEAANAAARAQQEAEAYRRSEEYARKKAVEDIEAGFRGSLMESGTFILRLRNVSNQTADFQLRCFQNNGNYKTFPIALPPGGTQEIGFLEGWPGNFVSGEYCNAIYEGEALWKVTKK
ncbi:hypothetical protein ACK36F_11095 [Aeromonas veronii]